jgi:hypothetical protein
MKYIFRQDVNGYETYYYLISSDKELTQQIATEIQEQIPGARRLGTGIECFKKQAKLNGFNIEILTDGIQKIPVDEGKLEVIDNISGNY